MQILRKANLKFLEVSYDLETLNLNWKPHIPLGCKIPIYLSVRSSVNIDPFKIEPSVVIIIRCCLNSSHGQNFHCNYKK